MFVTDGGSEEPIVFADTFVDPNPSIRLSATFVIDLSIPFAIMFAPAVSGFRSARPALQTGTSANSSINIKIIYFIIAPSATANMT